ncbi:hypothetical protein V6N11_022508 [Hibiscus sabdariffa]|uniref:Trichome birefringence-like C-terminal domain-containing protein n=1 Tax=Hibiscus sabdariffa TaxID=183260 RepID=A0ABR2TJK3_9ROSI
MEPKAGGLGDAFRITGKHICLALFALVLTTLFLLDWEIAEFQYLYVYNSWSNHRFAFHSAPACFHHDPNNSTESMEPAEMKTAREKSQSLQKEERKEPEANVDYSETKTTDGNSEIGHADSPIEQISPTKVIDGSPQIVKCQSLSPLISWKEKYDFLQFLRNGAIHHHGWAYRFQTANTTNLHSWSARLCDREPIHATDPNTLYAMHLDCQPAFIRENMDQINVLVLNTAHHWSKQMVNMDKEVMYVNGAPVQDRNLKNLENAKIFENNIFQGSEVLQEESIDKVVAGAVEGTRVKIFDITALSDLRDEAHISHYGKKAIDCLHWCLPGVQDTWNELLSAQL